MIIKISDMLDAQVLYKKELEELPAGVQNAISGRLKELQEAFGNPYLESQFGGVAIYILTETVTDRSETVEKILRFYNIETTDELYEYSEIIGTGEKNVQYSEKLYLLSCGEKSILIFCAFE